MKAIEPSFRQKQIGKSKERTELNEEEDSTVIEGVSFDGRKNKTLRPETKDGMYHMKAIIEEHVTIV